MAIFQVKAIMSEIKTSIKTQKLSSILNVFELIEVDGLTLIEGAASSVHCLSQLLAIQYSTVLHGY